MALIPVFNWTTQYIFIQYLDGFEADLSATGMAANGGAVTLSTRSDYAMYPGNAGATVQLPAHGYITSQVPNGGAYYIVVPLVYEYNAASPAGMIAVYTAGAITILNAASPATPTIPVPAGIQVNNATPLVCSMVLTPAPPAALFAPMQPWTQVTLTPAQANWLLQNATALTLSFAAPDGSGTWASTANLFGLPLAGNTYTGSIDSARQVYALTPSTSLTFMGQGTFATSSTTLTQMTGAPNVAMAFATTPSFSAATSAWTLACQYAGTWNSYATSTMVYATNMTTDTLVIGPMAANIPGVAFPTPPGPPDTLLPTVDNPAWTSATPRTQTLLPGASAFVLFSAATAASTAGNSNGYRYFSVSRGSTVLMTNPIEVVVLSGNVTSTFGRYQDASVSPQPPPIIMNTFPGGTGFQGLLGPLTVCCALEMCFTNVPPVCINAVDPTYPPSYAPPLSKPLAPEALARDVKGNYVPYTAPAFRPLLTYPPLNAPRQGSSIVTAKPGATTTGYVLPPSTGVLTLVGYQGPLVFTVSAQVPNPSEYALIDKSFRLNGLYACTVSCVNGPNGLSVTGISSDPTTGGPYSPFAALASIQTTTINYVVLYWKAGYATVLKKHYLDNVCMQPGFRDCKSIAGLPQDTCLGYFSENVGAPCVTACSGRDNPDASAIAVQSFDETCYAAFSTYCQGDVDGTDLACTCINRQGSNIKFSFDGTDAGSSGSNTDDAQAYTYTNFLTNTRIGKALPASVVAAGACWWPPCNAGEQSALPDITQQQVCHQSFTACFAAVDKIPREGPSDTVSVDLSNVCGSTGVDFSTIAGASSGSDCGSVSCADAAAAAAAAAQEALNTNSSNASLTKKVIIIASVVIGVVLLVVILATVLSSRKKARVATVPPPPAPTPPTPGGRVRWTRRPDRPVSFH